jgi:hypothetical protein
MKQIDPQLLAIHAEIAKMNKKNDEFFASVDMERRKVSAMLLVILLLQAAFYFIK